MHAEKGLQRGGSGLVRFPPRKAVAFLTPFLRTPKITAQDVSPLRRRPGLLALDLASIFEKLLDQKTSLPPAALLKCDEFHSGKSLSDVFKK
ncbi:hypothetical protein [Ruminococcus sp.]|uniref:hypothetical protein n=1 Tax=Ruminococcus sp. TaxID=41978 RepID=UPI0025CDF910|nr:hypothetical protein [Ruminococcus sp.]